MRQWLARCAAVMLVVGVAVTFASAGAWAVDVAERAGSTEFRVATAAAQDGELRERVDRLERAARQSRSLSIAAVLLAAAALGVAVALLLRGSAARPEGSGRRWQSARAWAVTVVRRADAIDTWRPRYLLFAGAALGLGGLVLARTAWRAWVVPAPLPTVPGVAAVVAAFCAALVGIVLMVRSARMSAAGAAAHVRRERVLPEYAYRSLMLGGYLAVLGWFKYFDVWREHFSDGGFHYVVYNLARAAFVFYLGIVLIETGNLLNRRLTVFTRGERPEAPPLLDAFFLGSAIWILGGFVLGLVNGIYWAPLAALTAVLVWRGYPAARRLAESARSCISTFGRASLSSLALASALAVSLLLVIALIVVNVGFGVFGFEYDAYGHYQPYYAQVVAQHSTAPNEYWYHFWVSKGAFLHFLAVVLTDIQGPRLVSFLMLLAALAAAYRVIRNATGDWRWGTAATVVLAAPFMAQFHFFPKHHIVTLGLAAGLLWLSRPGLPDVERASIWQALALTLMGAAAVCNTPPMAAVVLPYFFCFGIWLHRRRGLSLPRAFLPFGASAFLIAGILCLNHVWTGLAEVTPFKMFMSFGDQEILSRHVSPYLLLLVTEGSTDTTGRLTLEALSSRAFIEGRLTALLRTQGLIPQITEALPWLVLAVVAAIIVSRRFRQVFASHLGATLLLLSVAVAFGFFVNQPGSIERFYTFAYYPLVLLAVGSAGLLWWRVNALCTGGVTRGFMQLVAAVLTVGIAIGTASYRIAQYLWLDGPAYLKEKVAFVTGRRTFEQALTYVHKRPTENGWPRRDLSQECLSLQRLLDRADAEGAWTGRPKVWTLSFLQESGCHILPGIQIQMEFSVGFGPHWHRIVFGTPEEAAAELAKIDVNYFYVNLGDFDIMQPAKISTSIFGCLAYSPLFQPDSLKSRFRIAWREGDAVLLTLAGGSETGRIAITDEFLEQWAHKTQGTQLGLGDMGGLCGRLAHYYRTQGERWPVGVDRSLPPIKGWQ